MQEDWTIEIDLQAEFGVGAARCYALRSVAGSVACLRMRKASEGIPVHVGAADVIVREQVV